MARSSRLLFVALVTASSASVADEGMWTLDNFPAAAVQQKYGFSPTREWLDRVRLSSIHLNSCSSSIVSPDGLVMTNHHCVHQCIQQLSTKKKDLVVSGFYAADGSKELRCPEVEADQLLSITDVTARIQTATKGLEGAAYNAALKSEMARVEKECAKDDLRCDVVTLYRGGRYNLYQYKRFQDVRLVFAPEFAIAFFGGDPDNFMFPRYDLDVAFVRLYENGQQAKTPAYLPWSEKGAAEKELTFVSGHPGGTNRLLTVAQLEFQRDVLLPARLLFLAELRGFLTEFQNRGDEAKRISQSTLFSVSNALKALRGRHSALLDKKVFDAKVVAEKALRAKIDADPKLKKEFAGAWDETAKALETFRPIRKHYNLIEEGRAFSSDLFRIARTLVRSAEELPKVNDKRLREYTDAKLPQLKQKLFSTAPVYNELELATLTFSLEHLRQELTADDPIVRQILGKRSPQELAASLVKGSKVSDVKVRKALFEGGQKAIEASVDPMILLARQVDADARAVRKVVEEKVEAVAQKSGEQIAQALFAVYGTNRYPDATGTLRLSYGQVAGYQENGREVKPITTFAGAFERHTGRDPYALPKSWIASKDKIDLNTPMNFVTTNDIIGGNSGSPVVNKQGQVVGLIFDGNIQSLGGDFGYEELSNRAVAVHTSAIIHALDKIYDARRLVQELRPSGGAAAGGP